MDSILILTTDRTYGRYLQNLSDQLYPGLHSVVKNPADFDPKGFQSGTIVVDHEDLYDGIKKKLGENGSVSFIVLAEKPEAAEEKDNCRVLPKPLDGDRFLQALFQGRGGKQSSPHTNMISDKLLNSLLVGSSSAMKQIRSNILRVSDTALPVLIQGETGTGKGVVARSLHNCSSRSQHPFMEINCANVPSALLESELFGHKLGAFTGAWKDKLGKLQLAADGTVFLDEISEMSPHMQAKLLQVPQEGEFSPVGGTDDIKVDIRIIAATNAELKKLIAQSRFRSDLYYRLAVISVMIPPLRERQEDVEILSTYFLEKYSRKYGKKSISVSEKLKRMLERYHWPGNVRELENMIKTLVVMESEELIVEELQTKLEKNGFGSFPFTTDASPDGQGFSLKEATEKAVKKAEKQLIDKAIARTRGNKKRAAKLLSISYKSLLNKTKAYGL